MIRTKNSLTKKFFFSIFNILINCYLLKKRKKKKMKLYKNKTT